MEVTGQEFDMDPKTFTLGNMFAMQLHKYAEEIGKITNAAVKELTVRFSPVPGSHGKPFPR
jgi:dynein heavy chain